MATLIPFALFHYSESQLHTSSAFASSNMLAIICVSLLWWYAMTEECQLIPVHADHCCTMYNLMLIRGPDPPPSLPTIRESKGSNTEKQA